MNQRKNEDLVRQFLKGQVGARTGDAVAREQADGGVGGVADPGAFDFEPEPGFRRGKGSWGRVIEGGQDPSPGQLTNEEITLLSQALVRIKNYQGSRLLLVPPRLRSRLFRRRTTSRSSRGIKCGGLPHAQLIRALLSQELPELKLR